MDDVDGTVRDFSRFGEGVVKTEMGMVFVPGVLPGERVALSQIRKHAKGVLRTDRVELLDRSSQRVEPGCPIVGTCGGCPLMIASPKLQAKFKRGLLEKAVGGFPNAHEIRVGWVDAEARLGYRRRARLAWLAPTGRRPRIGYHPPRSDQVADVRRCAVLHPSLDEALRHLREALGSVLVERGEIHIAMGEGGKAVAALRSEMAQPTSVFDALAKLVEDKALAGTALRAGGATVDATWGEPRELRDGVDGFPLLGTVAGFSQAHDEVNRALVGRVIELVRPADREILELFSGSGNLTVALAREAKALVAVESDEEAAAACRRNLRARGLEGTVRAGDAETYRAQTRPDVVVLDPPRTGAAGAVKRIIKMEIPEVVYVSCDPPTLGRDLRTLYQAGYVATDAVGLDMFPQTAHLESVVRLERRAS